MECGRGKIKGLRHLENEIVKYWKTTRFCPFMADAEELPHVKRYSTLFSESTSLSSQ